MLNEITLQSYPLMKRQKFPSVALRFSGGLLWRAPELAEFQKQHYSDGQRHARGGVASS